MTARRLEFRRIPFKAMGSPCEIQMFAGSDAEASRASNLVIADVERLEALYSRYRDTSFLSKINRVAATGGPMVNVKPAAEAAAGSKAQTRSAKGAARTTAGIRN